MAAVFRIFLFIVMLATPVIALAQPPSMPRLTGPQKRTLLLIAREAVDASAEGRSSREATVEARLSVPQSLVVSIYVDGRLRGRAWSLKGGLPLYLGVKALAYEAIKGSRDGQPPLTVDELVKAKVAVAVLSNYVKAADDREVPPGSAVVIYNGFTEGLALPDDIESGKAAADLLSRACQDAGLRPNVWLLPQTTIYSAAVEQTSELTVSKGNM